MRIAQLSLPCSKLSLISLMSLLLLVGVGVRANEPMDVEAGMLGSTRSVHVFGKTILCGQPSPKDFATAKQRGIKTVITLRLPGEIDWNEAKTVKDLGLTFHDLGFQGPDSMTDDLIAKAVSILAQPDQQPVMLHCASANRVGAIWMAHRVINDGLSVDAAAAEGKEVGLRTPAYEARVRKYLKKRKKKSAQKSDNK